MKPLSKEGTYIANLDPESNINFSDISRADTKNVFDYLDNNFKYALFSDGNIINVSGCNMEVSLNYVNDEYYKLFDYNTSQGEKINFDYQYGKDEIPVLIGTGLNKSYPIGSTIVITDPSVEETLTLKVVGILEKNTYHSNYYALNWKNYYNFSIFIPVNKAFMEAANVEFHLNAIMNAIVLETTEHKTHVLGDVLLENLGLKFNFYSQNENYLDFFYYYKKSMGIQLIFTTITFAIALCLTYWNTMKSCRFALADCSIDISADLEKIQIKKVLYSYYGIFFVVELLALILIVSFERYKYWINGSTMVAAYGFMGLIGIDWIAFLIVLFVDVIFGVSLSNACSNRLTRIR